MIAETLAIKAFEAAAARLAVLTAEKGFAFIADGVRAPKDRLNLYGHLQNTFERCSQTKTLLNPDTPIKLMDLYVGCNFSTSKHTEAHEIIDDFELIERIWDKKRITIFGSAGTGKSFFTKYFWLTCFERPRGKIPIFVELRNLNDLTSVPLVTYVRRTIAGTTKTPGPVDAFESAVAKGSFVFIFDGFDEIREDKKDAVAKEILALAAASNENVIVVTSRPDESINAWQPFWGYHVNKLDKKQVLELLGKVNFDPQVKKKFMNRVEKGLYDKHQSLLSTPLLATIMLLTFGSFADIPNKIHVFYEQAFETLYARHDALKDSYKRQLASNLPIDVFKNQFGAFCLLTYDKELYSFSNAQILEYIKKSTAITGLKFDVEHFLKDLLDSVCMLQRDGLSYVFTHRSFQEFFAARFLSRMELRKVSKLLPRYLYRFTDSTGGMLFDLNRDLVEQAFLIPTFRELKSILIQQSKLSGIEETCKSTGEVATLELHTRVVGAPKSKTPPETKREVTLRFNSGEYHKYCSVMLTLFKVDIRSENNGFIELMELDERALRSKSGIRVLEFAKSKIVADKRHSDIINVFKKRWLVPPETAALLEDWFAKGGYTKYLQIKSKRVLGISREMVRQSEARSASIESLLELPG